MSHPNSPVWVIAGQVDGFIPVVCLELIGQARKLADELGVDVEVFLLGKDVKEQIDLLFFSGADVVYQGNSPEYEI
ncbi:MAG: hypothetical protein KAS84_07970, partial [Anaerolineales bacterium]|nr:hypothetical protein [Anaerolineales bacterium]